MTTREAFEAMMAGTKVKYRNPDTNRWINVEIYMIGKYRCRVLKRGTIYVTSINLLRRIDK